MRVSALLAGSLLCLATSVGVQAATYTQTETFAAGLTAVPVGGLSQSYSIDKFDVAGMTLLDITVEFGAQTYGSVTITRANNGANSVLSFGNIGLRQDFTLSASANTLASLPDVATNTISVNVNRSQTVVSATAPASPAALIFGSATTTVSLAPGLFSLFQGVGSLNLALDILRDNFAATIPTNAGTYSITYDNEATAAVQVTYTYVLPEVAVPAPMSVGVLGAGLVGLVAVRRKRGRQV